MTGLVNGRIKAGDAGLLVLVAFIWGFNFVVITIGLKDFPPLLFSAMRFAACWVLVFLFPKPDMLWRDLIAIGVTLGILVFGLLFIGMNAGMPAGLASVVMQMQVFFTVLLGVFVFKERPIFLNWLAILVGGAGLGLIAFERMSHGGWTAFTLVLLGAFSWGVANILMKRLPNINMLNLMIWMSLVPPVPLLALSLGLEGWPSMRYALENVTWLGVFAVLYTALLSTIVAYAIWGKMLQRYPTSTVAPFALLTPIFGLLCSSVFLGEHHSILEGLASFLVIVALALNVWASRKQSNTDQSFNALKRPAGAGEDTFEEIATTFRR